MSENVNDNEQMGFELLDFLNMPIKQAKEIAQPKKIKLKKVSFKNLSTSFKNFLAKRAEKSLDKTIDKIENKKFRNPRFALAKLPVKASALQGIIEYLEDTKSEHPIRDFLHRAIKVHEAMEYRIKKEYYDIAKQKAKENAKEPKKEDVQNPVAERGKAAPNAENIITKAKAKYGETPQSPITVSPIIVENGAKNPPAGVAPEEQEPKFGPVTPVAFENDFKGDEAEIEPIDIYSQKPVVPEGENQKGAFDSDVIASSLRDGANLGFEPGYSGPIGAGMFEAPAEFKPIDADSHPSSGEPKDKEGEESAIEAAARFIYETPEAEAAAEAEKKDSEQGRVAPIIVPEHRGDAFSFQEKDSEKDSEKDLDEVFSFLPTEHDLKPIENEATDEESAVAGEEDDEEYASDEDIQPIIIPVVSEEEKKGEEMDDNTERDAVDPEEDGKDEIVGQNSDDFEIDLSDLPDIDVDRPLTPLEERIAALKAKSAELHAISDERGVVQSSTAASSSELEAKVSSWESVLDAKIVAESAGLAADKEEQAAVNKQLQELESMFAETPGVKVEVTGKTI